MYYTQKNIFISSDEFRSNVGISYVLVVTTKQRLSETNLRVCEIQKWRISQR